MILALDTASRQAGLALYDGEHVRFESLWHSAEKFHTEWLVPAIENALRQAGVNPGDLTAVAVTRGPGSYTGIRVAMSVAKGLVAALGLPIIGVNALDVAARPFREGGALLCVSVPLGRGRFAYRFYPAPDEENAPAVAAAEVLADALAARGAQPAITCVGEFSRAERELFTQRAPDVRMIPPALAVRRPAVLAMLAAERLAAGAVDDPHTLEPLYLQP